MGWNNIRGKRKPEIDEHRKFVRTVAGWLGETNNPPVVYLLHRIIEVLGQPRVFDLLKATLAVEESGGMRTLKGERRRTVGGTFFRLAKEQYGEQLPFLLHGSRRPAPPILDCRLPRDESRAQ